MTDKICTKCGVSKPFDAFAKNGSMGRHTSCKACQCAAHKALRILDGDRVRTLEANRHEKNRGKRLEANRAYSKKNAAARSALERARYLVKREEIKARNYAYRAANMGKVYVWNSARRAAEKRATPRWVDLSIMGGLYELAAIYSKVLGPIHVDHIEPLNGAEVCGLHVQHNLQLLPATDNLKKGVRRVDGCS